MANFLATIGLLFLMAFVVLSNIAIYGKPHTIGLFLYVPLSHWILFVIGLVCFLVGYRKL